MRLIKVGCEGFKRFRESTEMDVDEKLIAIVGPNEAGKSSFLQALDQLESDDAFPDTAKTRGSGAGPRVWARYVLEEDDKAALGAVPEAREVRQMIVSKRNARSTRLEPDVMRDRSARESALKLIERALDLKFMKGRSAEDPLWNAVGAAKAALSSDEEDLDDTAIEAISALAGALRGEALPAALKGLPGVLRRAHENEVKENPWGVAVRILEARRPMFLLFSADDRDLRSSYDFSEEPNQALHNLLSLANTSWSELYRVSTDPGALEGVLERARRSLDATFTAWRQSKLVVRVHVADNAVSVLVRMSARSDYLAIEERSDGLRQFVALRGHVASNRKNDARPVLLIDEADVHLHYDAQADLVQVLDEQVDARQIIYTTHSAGCLPQDMGRGIRIVAPVVRVADGRTSETDDSKVINWFWTNEIQGVGFSPVLIGMGASALAFASTRRAVIAEGPSDAILLPTLLREANGLDRLDYQVAPGLSNVDEAAARELDLVAARVAYVLDGDGGGDEKEGLLVRAGIPKRRILRLRSGRTPLVLEDLLDRDVYCAAINEEIAEWAGGAQMPATAIPKTRRPQAVRTWCEAQAPPLMAPSKRAIAHRILELARSRGVVAAARQSVLEKLHSDIQALLDAPSHI